MKRTLYALLCLCAVQSLVACSGQQTNPDKYKRSVVSASHSIYIEGGVLKVFSDGEQNMLYLYVRPTALDRWVASGGGGGNQANPWHYSASMSWALGDENGWFPKDAPRETFTCLFDSERMMLTIDARTYAVRRGDLVVIALDENWRPHVVGTGTASLEVFGLSEVNRERLELQAHRNY